MYLVVIILLYFSAVLACAVNQNNLIFVHVFQIQTGEQARAPEFNLTYLLFIYVPSHAKLNCWELETLYFYVENLV